MNQMDGNLAILTVLKHSGENIYALYCIVPFRGAWECIVSVGSANISLEQ